MREEILRKGGAWEVGFWVGLRARDFPTERVLSRAPLIIRTVDINNKRGTHMHINTVVQMDSAYGI